MIITYYIIYHYGKIIIIHTVGEGYKYKLNQVLCSFCILIIHLLGVKCKWGGWIKNLLQLLLRMIYYVNLLFFEFSYRLCNGTRLRITSLIKNLIQAEILACIGNIYL